MQEPLVDGGVIRKSWIGEAASYRNHLLRLNRGSREGRFGSAVSDEFIENYATTTFGLDAVVHGFFADGVLRGAAELRPLGRAFARQAEAALSIEADWQSHGVGAALLAAPSWPPATAASRRCTWPASPATAGCRNWRGSSRPSSRRLRRRGRRGHRGAADPAVGAAGTRGRPLRLCHRRPRRPVEALEPAIAAGPAALTDWRGLALS